MKIAERINHLLGLGAAHFYFRSDGSWYHQLKRFPGVLIDPAGYVLFATEKQYLSNPIIRIDVEKDEVHVVPGISSLLGYRHFSPAQLALIYEEPDGPPEQEGEPTDEAALRKKRVVDALIRNKKFVAELKTLYDNTCQICGERIRIRPGIYYSEIHHIKPLGQKHQGPDRKNNMICVCPNHHALLDFFTLRLDLKLLKNRRHPIQEAYVAYHNERVDGFNLALGTL
jgi:5-methylcytosine-specific restriction protein A